MYYRTFRLALATLAASLGVASGAQAETELQFDVNSISTRISSNASGEVFSENFTGSLRLGHDDNSYLSRILVDGANMGFDDARSDGFGWAMSHFSAKINILNGTVLGGFLFLEVESYTGGLADGVTNTYEATFTSGQGEVNRQAGQGYSIDGLTIDGMFSDSTFAGIDISRWFGAQPLVGSFINFSFDPGQDPFGVDENSHIDIFVTVPLPTSVLFGLASLPIFTIIRRRRLDAIHYGV